MFLMIYYLVTLFLKICLVQYFLQLSLFYSSLSPNVTILTSEIVKKLLSLLLMFKTPSLELEKNLSGYFHFLKSKWLAFNTPSSFLIYWSTIIDKNLRTWSEELKSGINLRQYVSSKWNFETTFITISFWCIIINFTTTLFGPE